ncbi:hypothetical protein [Archangium sp.]|uniref:hypothetical protein n=1 Tax=Archangium sp. TaxID=1872627 RepID=UPI002D3AD07A|nr:hypothetical protein [Archangium sp.]HYO57578.1 hypothetical protein [Archangium sp.]
MHARVTPVLYLLLLVPLAVRATPPGVEARLTVLEPVEVRGYEGDEGQGLKLTFKKLGPNPALALWTLEEAREVVKALEEEKHHPGAAVVGLLTLLPDEQVPALERRVREEYEAILGGAQVPLLGSLESARWFQALKLSPSYMGEGVREAAVEMFSSRAVVLSVGMAMVLYMMAWAAPEPVFSKAYAGAVTLWLLMTYTAAELYGVGQACLKLYREAEEAGTREELEEVAERFGKAMGGVGLRVLVTVAGAKLTRSLPEVPRGGLWARLSPPRFAFAGGGGRGSITVGAGTRARVSVADGTVVLMGVTANTTAAAVASAVASARTTGECAESKQKAYQRHHLCTN